MGKARKRWPVAEKRRIVELTLEPGVSAAQVAQSEGVNANQVFQWRRSYLNGELQAGASTVLLPVVIGAEAAPVAEIASAPEIAKTAQGDVCPVQPSGAIHVELPGGASISVERGADRILLRTILESLRS